MLFLQEIHVTYEILIFIIYAFKASQMEIIAVLNVLCLIRKTLERSVGAQMFSHGCLFNQRTLWRIQSGEIWG